LTKKEERGGRTVITEEDVERQLQTELRGLNLELLELREKAGELELKIQATRAEIINHGKMLQAVEAGKSKDQIAAGGAPLRTRPRKDWRRHDEG
jgi:hypothetical protein